MGLDLPWWALVALAPAGVFAAVGVVWLWAMLFLFLGEVWKGIKEWWEDKQSEVKR